MVFKDPNYKASSPLVVAAKSPQSSPALGPAEEPRRAVPIDEVDFELLPEDALDDLDAPASSSRPRGDSMNSEAVVAQSVGGLRDEPAYIVPTTPSPFLHSAVPPFSSGGYNYGGALPEAMLPMAFDGDAAAAAAAMGMWQDPQMWNDPNNFAGYAQMYHGWNMAGMSMEGCQGFDNGYGGAHQHMLGQDTATGSDMKDWKVAAKEFATSDEAVLPATAEEASAAGSKEAFKKEKSKRIRGGAAEEKKMEGSSGKAAAATSSQAAAPAAASATKRGKNNDDDDAPGVPPPPVDKEAFKGCTTVMLRNIPNKYTREMLVKQLASRFYGQFDFMYLPIDFKNKCNVGYSFINFRTPEFCESFVSQFHGVDVRDCLPGLNSRKVVEVTPARVQGLIENVRRLRNSPVMNQLQEHPEWMPLVFNDKGEEEHFPMPDQPLPPVKPRSRNRDGKIVDG